MSEKWRDQIGKRIRQAKGLMALTEEQKKANRFERMLESFKCFQLGKCIKKTAIEFQRLIRLRSCDDGGVIRCVTCSRVSELGRDMDAGHFISRSRRATIFNEMNCAAQCARCNQYEGGKPAEFRKYLVERHGEEAVAELERLGATEKQFTREELVALRIGFMDAIKVEEKRLGMR